jgi:predicted Rossmann fold nucleotide-binding protein DprA/Smf involved in DNA uptake
MKTLIAALAILTTVTFAEAPKWGDDLSKTVHQATRENKLGFIVLGREQCGNCQATKRLVNEGKIPVTTDAFVIADLNIDDQKTQAEFMRKYKKLEFGSILPYVVVTDSRGKALAHASGFKGADHWTKVIEEAKAQAATAKK